MGLKENILIGSILSVILIIVVVIIVSFTKQDNDEQQQMLRNTVTPPATTENPESCRSLYSLPAATNTEKYAIVNPLTGMIVYDKTLGVQSVYNGINWVQPSFLRLGIQSDTDLNPGDIPFGFGIKSPDDRITNSGSIITIKDIGVYIVNACMTFTSPPNNNESKLFIEFVEVKNNTNVVIISSGTNHITTGFEQNKHVAVNSSINSLLKTTQPNQTFKFRFRSLEDDTSKLSRISHGYILRIM